MELIEAIMDMIITIPVLFVELVQHTDEEPPKEGEHA